MKQLSESNLMELVQKGNNKAIMQLIERHRLVLINYFYRMGGDILTAEELLQETFTKMYLYRESFNVDKSFFSWLYQIARNVWATYYKKRQRNLIRPASGDLPDVELTESLTQKLETQQLVQVALEQLSDEDRQLVVLYHLKGHSYAESIGLFEL